MTALSRQQVKIFASNALSSQVTAFRTTEEESPTFSKTPDVLQSEKYVTGWLNADNTGNVAPHVEDFNGLFLTSSYLTAYLYEKGIPEYLATQTYYINSFCQYQGKLYRCKVDNTVNYLPTDTSKWDELSVSAYTASNIGTGDYSIYAGTNSAGTEFQFKKLIAGTNVTMLETDDSLTINSTQGTASFTANSPLSYSAGVLSISQASSSANGYLSSSDWTSFNSKLSSTIFSANNSWTGTNTFSAITLGQDDLATTLSGKQNTIDANNKLSTSYLNVNSSIIPTSNNTYSLGSLSNGYWYNVYSTNVQLSSKVWMTTEDSSKSYGLTWRTSDDSANVSLQCVGTSVRAFQVGSGGGISQSVNLGDQFFYWKAVYTNNVTFTPTNYFYEQGGLTFFQWHNNAGDNNLTIFWADNKFKPYQNNGIDLGDNGNRWATIWGNNFGATQINFYEAYNSSTQRGNIRAQSDGNFIIHKESYGSSENRITVEVGSTGTMLRSGDTSWSPASDRRLKKNIIDLDDCLDKILQLRSVRYDLKTDETDNSDRVGFIAQEVQPLIPEIVNGSESDNDFLGIKYTELIPFLVKALQELSVKVTDLENKLEAINGN